MEVEDIRTAEPCFRNCPQSQREREPKELTLTVFNRVRVKVSNNSNAVGLTSIVDEEKFV